MKRNETDATLKGVGICSLLLSGAISVFTPALRISPDTPHLRRLEYVGVERRIDWVTPGLLGVSAVLAGVGYVTSNALVKREAIADEISDAELAKEMMAYKLTDEMQIEEAVRYRGEGNSDKVIEVLVGKPEEPSPIPPPPAIAPSCRPEVRVNLEKKPMPTQAEEVVVTSSHDDVDIWDKPPVVRAVPEVITKEPKEMSKIPTEKFVIPLRGGIVPPDDNRVVALWRLIEESAPEMKVVLKAKPLAVIGGMGSYKTNFVKWLCLLRILLLGHRINVADPHAHYNSWPEQFAVYGHRYDYGAIDARLRRHLELRNREEYPITSVFDEMSNYHGNCDTKLLEKIIGSAVADDRKSSQGTLTIAHALLKQFFGNVSGGVTVVKEQWTKVFLYNKKNEVGDDEPQFKGHIQVGNGGEIPITLFPEWMHPDFLLETFPELRDFRSPTENPEQLSEEGIGRVRDAFRRNTKDISTWPSIPLDEKKNLPAHSGVYAVLDTEKTVKYIGESANVLLRWNSLKYGPHHCQERAENLDEPRIAWFLVGEGDREELEAELVAQYKPQWNGGKFGGTTTTYRNAIQARPDTPGGGDDARDDAVAVRDRADGTEIRHPGGHCDDAKEARPDEARKDGGVEPPADGEGGVESCGNTDGDGDRKDQN